MFNRLAVRLTACLAILVVLAMPAFAQVPGLGTSSKVENSTALQQLIDEAKADGSTVIVVQPKQDVEEKATEGAMLLDRDQLLKVRQRIATILKAIPTLPEAIISTLQEAGKGALWWVVWGIGTAAIGLTIGWFITRQIQKRVREMFGRAYNPNPETVADKAIYLLARAMMAVIHAVLLGAIAWIVAIILDSGLRPARLLAGEVIIGYVTYRVLRYAVSWNLIAHDVPSHRLPNLTDTEALRLHRSWYISLMPTLFAAGAARFLVQLGFQSPDGQFAGSGDITLTQAQALYVVAAAIAVVSMGMVTVLNWKAWRNFYTPRDPAAPAYQFRRAFARAIPTLTLLYGGLALVMFTYRVAILQGGAGWLIAGPFVIAYVALIVTGLALIVIQFAYRRRIRRLQHLADVERARREKEEEANRQHLEESEGEEIVTHVAATDFEYQPLMRPYLEGGLYLIVGVVVLGELARVWGVDVGAADNSWASILDIVLAVGLAWIGYRAVCAWVDRRMSEEMGDVPDLDDDEAFGAEGGGGGSRMATLLPIFRWVLVAVILVAAIVVVLSEFGFDIGPIFAGAGVVGIAVGFGAQKLIQDVFSGAFFLMDDAFRKGEYVEIEGVKGVVEKISIRSFQLRHHLGALHTLPFGEIRQLTNYSRDWVMMKLPLRVTYDTDVEKVRKLVKKLGQRLLEHDQVGHTFMQPLKSQGVYAMEDSAMIIRVKFMTKPGEQFVTRKIVYQEIQDLFAREGIHFAHKEVTVRLADGEKAENLSEEEKKAVTAAARTVIDAEQEAAAAAGGKKAPAGP